MAEERDYDYVVGKLPRKDKSGNDASGDKIGKGGRHREDGTFSGMAYDLKVVDSDPTKPVPPPPPRVITRTEYVDRTPSLGEELVYLGVSKAVDFGLQKAEEGIRHLWNQHRMKKEEERRQRILNQRRQEFERTQSSQQTASVSDSTAVKTQQPVVLPADFDGAYQNYTIDMTSEEAQKKLFEAFVFQYLCMKNLNELAHARIVDVAGNVVEGREVVAKLSNPKVVQSINQLLACNPSLLNEWQAKALSDALGRELIRDEHFIPIRRSELIAPFVRKGE